MNGNSESPVVNVYDLDLESLKVLDLNACGGLAWIAEVVANRGINQEAANVVGNRLAELYRPDVSEYDIVKGCRADDSYT